MAGKLASTAGVNVDPTATPRTVRIPLLTGLSPRSGIPTNAARRHAAIGPRSQGSGMLAALKAQTPTSAIAKVKATCITWKVPSAVVEATFEDALPPQLQPLLRLPPLAHQLSFGAVSRRYLSDLCP